MDINDLQLDHAEIRDGHPLKPGGVKFEDMLPMTVREMKAKYNPLHHKDPLLKKCVKVVLSSMEKAIAEDISKKE